MKRKLKKITYKDIAIEWLTYKKDYIKESSYANYSNIMYNHLLPDLGNLYLSNINHELLQKYILDKLNNGSIKDKKPLSQKTVKDIVMILKSTIKYAMNQDIINQINLDFKYPKNSIKPKIHTFSKREQKKITEYIIKNPTSRNIGIMISLYTGIRIGELCALKWSDIDFRNNIIHVNKTLQRIYLKDSNETISTIIISSPKTITSNRDIPMNKEFAEIIKPLKVNSNFYILTSKTEYIEPRAYRKYFISLLKRLNIKPINFHSLRHTFATNCISLGIDYKTVSELLGHSSIDITLNLYVHPNLSQKKKCINIIWKNHN